MLREELESVTAELNSALMTSHGEIEKLRQSHADQTRDLSESRAQVINHMLILSPWMMSIRSDSGKSPLNLQNSAHTAKAVQRISGIGCNL